MKKNPLILLIFIILLILMTGFFKILNKFPSFSLESTLKKYANQIISRCASSKDRPACYDRELPKLMDLPFNISMEDAFKATRLIQEKDDKYLYCHILGHKLSSKETKKDPSKWKEVIARCPSNMCNNGCSHGALMEKFNSEYLTDDQIKTIIPELKQVCEPRGSWNPVQLEISMCYHGLGHLNMYMTNANVNRSISICKEIGINPKGVNHIQTCIEGVFMQIFQPLEPEDIALTKDLTQTKESVHAFCDKFPYEVRDACYRESWTLFKEEILKPEGLDKFCSYTKIPAQQTKCYAALVSFIATNFVVRQDNLEGLVKFCGQISKEHQATCFAHAARRMIQIEPAYANKAIEICLGSTKYGEGEACYKMLVSLAKWTFHPKANEYYTYCKLLPSPWNEKCLNQN